ncbi:hypothetical protein RFI_35329 [Reticulomyxa filosa]|uniref:Uncharacterized protein n=1 Tax=Reticulomyxa filosa TaxID=46433 RepID=X6LJI2_RETFI|nr:hypothetical protein RFI_35329 [Reticulomyxa filosa]|eukprot:ETO02113.1 hypothetical protein RFI_35329 [Reticulomyxa filosa]
MINYILILQNNINYFYSKQHKFEQNFKDKQPHVCMSQEGFRLYKKKDIDYHFYLRTNDYQFDVEEASLGGSTNYINKDTKSKVEKKVHKTSNASKLYKLQESSTKLRISLRQKKHEYIVKNVDSVQEGNTRKLFSKFR